MKHFLFKALPVVFLLAAWTARAQRPVTIGVSSHFVNFTPDKYFPGEYWQIGIAKLSVGIPLSDRLALSPAFGFGDAKAPGGIDKRAFWYLDLSLQYALTKTKLQPYLTAGAGVNHFNDQSNGTFNGGLGLNYWITPNFALNAQTNFDATPNYANYWHNSVGLAFKIKGGPKDSDKDGIPDVADSCPNAKGPAATHGCPDQDLDGVADQDDLCPNEKGSAATKGCPDTDGDGVADKDDQCPQVAGLKTLAGCPDTDGDGVADKDDQCPQVAGLKALAGCPDTDGDGIADKDDACPTVKGTQENKGCPADRDKDGVPDANDQCPDIAGTAANKGCPEIKSEEKKQLESKLNVAAKLIQFETGSATIKAVSYKEIDGIVSIMNQYPASRFSVEGHTDNVGDAANNTILSGKRADAVKAYMVSKGIPAERLDAKGFGATRPLAANTTAAGRTQNRRVEIHLAE